MVNARSTGTPSEGWDRGEGRRALQLVASRRGQALRFAAGVFLAQLAVEAPALAQGSRAAGTAAQAAPGAAGKADPSAAADPDPEVVRLYNRGIEALKAKQWEKARDALLEAFKLQPLPQIAANLGYAEFMWGRFRDAAEHVSFFLREGESISPKDRQENEKRLADAKARIGTVTVQVNVAGARVLMDAHDVGVSPLSVPLFVEPGSRVFEAQKDGLTTGRQTAEVTAGSAPVVALKLTPLGSPALNSQSPQQSDKGAPGGAVIVQSAWPPSRIGVVAVGAGLAAVGIGLGVGFSAAAASQNRGAIAEVDYLVVRTEVDKLICPRGYDEPRCQKFAEFARARDTYEIIATAGFVVGGVAAAGALVAALWWPSNPAPAVRPVSSFMILPTPQGAVVTGSF
jgi:hypothetical protein